MKPEKFIQKENNGQGVELKEARETQFTLDNVVYVLENEFAITDAKDSRPTLATPQILGYGKIGCVGIVFYDPKNKVAALGHIYETNKIKEQSDDMLEALTMKTQGLKGLIAFIIRPELNQKLREDIENLQTELVEKGILSEPISVINTQSIVFDTKTGEFYKKPEKLSLPGHPSERPYGRNRYDKATGRPQWSKCYPDI